MKNLYDVLTALLKDTASVQTLTYSVPSSQLSHRGECFFTLVLYFIY